MMDMKKPRREILIVEDTAASLKLLTDILTSEGYMVRPASDGELALRSIQAKLPSLVLLDIRMPGIDGYEVCRRLKLDERTKEIPVIFLSSLSEVADKVRGFNLGAVDYISKPYNREELLARVKTHIELFELKNDLEALVSERTSKLKESENAYKELANRLSIVADYASDCEYWLGTDGRYIYVSPSCEKMTGYATEAFYSDANLMQRIIHPDDKARYSRHIFEVMNSRQRYASKEIRIITKDGQTRNIEHNCRAIVTKEGVWLGQRGSNRDITERVQAQEKMRQSEEQFRKLFKIIPMPLAISDAHGNIVHINDRFAATFGYSKEDIPVLEKWWELAYPNEEYRAWVLQSWGGVMQEAEKEDKDLRPIEYEVTCKNGEVKIIEISGISLGENFLATFFDVTERRQAQESLVRSNESLEKLVKEELEKSREKDYLLIKQSRLAAMGEMLSNIAHQWRQPLNALGILIQDVKEASKFGELDGAYIDKMIKQSMEQIQYMSQTIDDFRSFFKPDKEKAAFNLLSVVKHAEHLLLDTLTTFGVELDISIEPDLTIVGYENELVQVFLNIVKNSKDAIIEKNIKNPKIQIRAQQTKDEVIVLIKDNAGGIEEAVLDRIFEPYFTTKEQGKGTGIGLYMTKTIIEENMGGKITARNEDDGAVFEIRFRVSA